MLICYRIKFTDAPLFMLYVVICYMLYVICYMLYVIRYMLYVIRYMYTGINIGVLDACMHEVPVSCSAVPAVADSCVQHCVNSDVSVNVTSHNLYF